MNFVGRIFIILIFAMSLVFAATAVMVYSTHNNWKETAEKVKKEKDEAQSKASVLAKKQADLITSLEEQLQSKGNMIAQLTTTNGQFQKEAADSKAQLAQLQTDIVTAISAVEATHTQMKEAQGELVSLRDNFRASQEQFNKLLTDFVATADKYQDTEMKLSNLQNVSKELVQLHADATTVLNHFGLKGKPELYEGVPLHDVSGKITEVRPNGLVQVSIGSDVGLLQGHQLDVYRKADGRDIYVGVVEVVLTEPNRAACKILPEYRKGTVQINDVVTTEFSQERQKYQLRGGAHVATAN